MVYKLGNVKDLAAIPSIEDDTYKALYKYLNILESEYGKDRDLDKDDGGYVLYAPKGTNVEEIKAYFDYTKNAIEYVNRSVDICCAFYLLNNDFSVVIIMSIADAPDEIKEAFEEGY